MKFLTSRWLASGQYELTRILCYFEQLGFPALPEQAPTPEELQADEKTMRDLHHLLLETQISEGKLVCANCGHQYAVKEGIANFLLPSHLV